MYFDTKGWQLLLLVLTIAVQTHTVEGNDQYTIKANTINQTYNG